MENFSLRFSKFMNIAFKIILLLIVVTSIGNFIYYSFKGNIQSVIIIGFFILSSVIFYQLLKRECSHNKLLLGIIIYAFIIRFLWILIVDTVPISDFLGMIERSHLIINGDYSMFKGNTYYARFPHLTITVLYFSMISYLFTNALFVIKLLNIIYSTISVFICYLIVKDVFDSKKKGLIGGFIAAIYPSIIIYTSVNCGENIAIPFYLLSVYLFILVIKKKKSIWLLALSGISLSIGNLFRMVAMVMLIAYIMYILIYLNINILSKIKSLSIIISCFFIPLILTSFILRTYNITEFNLWRGSESAWTSILKGSNIEHYGRFNDEDAKIPDLYGYDYEKVEKACKEIVKERLTKTPLPKLVEFYIVKYVAQWKDGDCDGVFWTTQDVANVDLGLNFGLGSKVYATLIYLILLIFIYMGLYNKEEYRRNSIINLFYIILGGYILFYLISESQDRYSYIVSWLFIILPITGMEIYDNILMKINKKFKKIKII